MSRTRVRGVADRDFTPRAEDGFALVSSTLREAMIERIRWIHDYVFSFIVINILFIIYFFFQSLYRIVDKVRSTFSPSTD